MSVEVPPKQESSNSPGKSPSSSASRQGGTPRFRIPVWQRSPWKWLFSLRVGIVLLTVLTVASIVGTLIDPLEKAQRLVYYTWWFKLLLLALAVNMSCATYQTIVARILPSRPLRLVTNPAFFASAPNAVRNYDGSVETVADAFRRRGFAVRTEGDFGVARFGWFARFAAPISHFGLVLVLLAGFVSSWAAREGFVQIPEGGSVSEMTLRGTDGKRVPLGFTLTVDDFSTGFFPRSRIPSHFESHVTVSAAEGILYRGMVEVNHSPAIRGWRLHQTSYQELPRGARRQYSITPPSGDEALTVEASPGQQVQLSGSSPLWFTPEADTGWTILNAEGQVVADGRLAGTHGSDLVLRADQFEPDFVLGADRQATSRSEELNNPALRVTLLSDGAPAARQWLFGREDMKAFSHNNEGHFGIELVDIVTVDEERTFTVDVTDGHSGLLLGRVRLALGEEAPVGKAPADRADEPSLDDAAAGWKVSPGQPVTMYATVLTLTRNPTIPVIYFGCGIMMLGLVLGFFVPRREVWFMTDSKAGKLHVTANYRHPSDELDRGTMSILDKLSSRSGEYSSGQGAGA